MNDTKFSDLVRQRWGSSRAALGGAVSRPRPTSSQLVTAGQQGLAQLVTSKPQWGSDERVVEVAETLSLVPQGSEADRFTGLTRLNRLLDRMFMEDSDVAGMEDLVALRRELHLYLEH
jgi:cyanophycinase-like exopeptidase